MFVSEPIEPLDQSHDVTAMARGEPGVPLRFRWRDEDHEVVAILRRWKVASREGGRASGELYVRRHYVEIETRRGLVLSLYCERSTPRGRSKRRWFVSRIGSDPSLVR